MLAPHRDQENLVHSHHVPPRQLPKTPGARYPKTPLRHARNDENLPTAFAGKNGTAGASRLAGNDKTMTKNNGTRQPLMTPMDGRSRAVLGNKTTNAKTRTVGTVGVKDMVQEIEKTHGKPTGTQKPKQRSAEIAPIKFDVKPDKDETPDDDEPEYAPPAPKPLPYQSDCFPEGGVNLDVLKDENLLKGFYSHFHNPVDENGVSRKEKEFNREMKMVMERAEERNERDADALDWAVLDVSDTAKTSRKTTNQAKQAKQAAPANAARRTAPKQQNPPTMASKKAASALAMPSGGGKANALKPATSHAPARKPLGSMLQSKKASANNAKPRPASTTAAAAEAASRTTIGYNKGRSASSMIHSHGRSGSGPPNSATLKSSGLLDQENDLTITPARAHQADLKKDSASEEECRPQFMSIFDDDGDEEDLAPMRGAGGILGQEEEEEFELKLED